MLFIRENYSVMTRGDRASEYIHPFRLCKCICVVADEHIQSNLSIVKISLCLWPVYEYLYHCGVALLALRAFCTFAASNKDYVCSSMSS